MISDSESRVTRSRRSLQRSVLVFGSCLMLVAALRAQEEPAPQAPASPAPASEAPVAGAKSPTAQADPADQGDSTEQSDDAPPAAPAKSGSSASPQHFEPSEKVRADFDVSFPVDI